MSVDMSVDFSKECVVIVGLSNKQAFELREPSSISNHLLERKARAAVPNVIEALGLPSGVSFVSTIIIRNKSKYDEFKKMTNGPASRVEVDVPPVFTPDMLSGLVSAERTRVVEIKMPSGRTAQIPFDLFEHVKDIGVPIVWLQNLHNGSSIICFDRSEDSNISLGREQSFEAALFLYESVPWEESRVTLNGFDYRYKPLNEFSDFTDWMAEMKEKRNRT